MPGTFQAPAGWRAELADFWKAANRLSRAALAVAALSALILVSTLAGLRATGAGVAFYGVHLAVMALLFVLFGKIAWHHTWSVRRPHAERIPGRVPRTIKCVAIAAFALCAVLLITTAVVYGHGGPELRGGEYHWIRDGRTIRAMTLDQYHAFQSQVLRVFASGWLALSLIVAWVGQAMGGGAEDQS